MKKVLNLYKLLYRILLVLVSSLFVFAGIDKILLGKEMVKVFNSFGLPIQLMVTIGFTELILAVMLQSKYFTKLATHALMTILLFAIFFHSINYQYGSVIAPIIVFLMLITTNILGQKIKDLS
jgi:uncharacterized membrane protein YphA (DoxX/SURF4 family)